MQLRNRYNQPGRMEPSVIDMYKSRGGASDFYKTNTRLGAQQHTGHLQNSRDYRKHHQDPPDALDNLQMRPTKASVEFILITDPLLQETMKDDFYHDLTLAIGPDRQEFSTNLTLFSLFSQKIRELMKHAFFKKTVIDELEFKHVDPEFFEDIISLLESGSLQIHRGNALGLLKVATYFEIYSLVSFLIELFENNSQFFDAFELYLFAFDIGSHYLIQLAVKGLVRMKETLFFSERLETGIQEDAFIHLLRN